ncbi:glutathione S-transferase family protein [Paraburkholderia sp. UYCP14C]|uniref:glutathione S-transferase family protein n=1 Tax=Paraburkholderia sp. UYCP14C TaxID=2511130 RepID=UPI001020E0F2|nr:glutathione S-transferase family protein [Paraburkholderia sp. UYCP14C]RZF25798.1 glutathione S-transferase family protein [Paraburkholderia sp. UYCP14C]
MTNSLALTVLGRSNSSNVQKVMWLLDEIEQPCVRVDMGGEFGGNKAADYLAKNPNGVVPTLIHGDVVVWESNSILRYLANRFHAAGLYPTDPVGRSWVDRWMDWQLSSLGPANRTLFQRIVRTPPEQRRQDGIDEARDQNAELFRLLDSYLERSEYLGGASFSIADIAVGPLAYRWATLPVERPRLGNLERWYASLCKREAFRKHVIEIGLS